MSGRSVDVAVLGGGVAGAALAAGLADAGLEVLVAERERQFVDKVRGEYVAPWGVVEAAALGVLDALEDRATRLHTMRLLDDADAAEEAVDLAGCVPRGDGGRGISHPVLCEALLALAAARGAEVRRGVDARLDTVSGRVRLVVGDEEVRPRLLVGADGAGSAVRRAIGGHWTRRPPRLYGAGLAVTGYCGDPEVALEGTAGEAMSYLIPQPGGRARLYLNYDLAAGAQHLAEPRAASFLAAYPVSWLRGEVQPDGPCRVVPLTDAWPERVTAPGFVLAGDAAGHCNPILGQGLAMAFFDARRIRDVLVATSPARWDAELAGTLESPRRELMRRMAVAADAVTAASATFGAAGPALRREVRARARSSPRLAMPLLAPFAGPHRLPSFGFADATLAALIAPPVPAAVGAAAPQPAGTRGAPAVARWSTSSGTTRWGHSSGR